MTESNTPSPELVAHANLLVGDLALTDEQVSRVIVCYHAALEGEPVGTSFIRDDGAIAKRMVIDGVPKWRIMDDDSVSFDTRATFDGVEGWELVKRPTPA